MSDIGFANPINMPRNNAEMAQYGNDRGLLVEFEMRPVLMEFESQKQGRQVYKELAFIHIVTPGAKTDIVRRVKETPEEAGPGVPTDPERFPRQWAAFKSQNEQVSDGMPLEHWPPIGKAQVMEFKALRIHTVEQLSAVPDNALHTFGMNGRRLRDMAKAYIDKAGEGAVVSRLTSENEALKLDVEALKAQFAELAAVQVKRGPGRPPKEG